VGKTNERHANTRRNQGANQGQARQGVQRRTPVKVGLLPENRRRSDVSGMGIAAIAWAHKAGLRPEAAGSGGGGSAGSGAGVNNDKTQLNRRI